MFQSLDSYLKNFAEANITIFQKNNKEYTRSNMATAIKLRSRLIAFYKSKGRWPKSACTSKRELTLYYGFVRLITVSSPRLDKEFRRLVRETGSNKTLAEIRSSKKIQILDYIKENGHAPGSSDSEERSLSSSLYNITMRYNDKTFLGQIYALDKCHKSGIPMKFRPIINAALDVDSPIKNLV